MDPISKTENAFFFSYVIFIVFQSFGEAVLHSMKSLLHSRKELCNISAEECPNREEHDDFIEVWHNLTIYIYFVSMIAKDFA